MHVTHNMWHMFFIQYAKSQVSLTSGRYKICHIDKKNNGTIIKILRVLEVCLCVILLMIEDM